MDSEKIDTNARRRKKTKDTYAYTLDIELMTKFRELVAKGMESATVEALIYEYVEDKEKKNAPKSRNKS